MEIEFVMTNEELSKAIDDTFEKLRVSQSWQSTREDFKDHLKSLLKIQLIRADMMVKEE